GYYRPATGTETHRHNHHDLAQEIQILRFAGARPITEKLDLELQEAGNPRAVVISAEALSLDIAQQEMRDRLDRFAALIGYRPHIILYVRPQPQAINSAFTQHVKTWRAGETFASFFESR